jgi:hypothetical protein
VTRRRLRFVAIQAIVVSALAAIVVLTLLQPESNTSLTGVSGPGATTIADGSTDQHPGDDTGGAANQHNGGGNSGGGNEGGSQAGPPEVAPSAPSPTVPAPIPGTTPGTAEPEGDSPSVDQYADTLARLNAELN